MPFFDDDGNELNPKDIQLPKLCADCKKNGRPEEYVLCTLTRLDQKNEEEFKCYSFEKLDLN